MVALTTNTTSIDLASAKTNGLHPLGVPIVETTAVKKGKQPEFLQLLETGSIARRFQNIRVTSVKTVEAGREFSKLIVQFEVFGDDWCSVGNNTGVTFLLYQGDTLLHELKLANLFVPYCRSWYEDQFERTIPNEVFDALDRLEFVANPDEMQPG